MIQRYYFDVETDQELIQDYEGVKASSLEQALNDARSVIQEMVNQSDDGDLDGTWALIVRDNNRSLIARLPFKKTFDSFDCGTLPRRIRSSH
ncbi:hypothetical protein FV242_29365 [Methylobacterium sp. WL64]|uniref:DUF6894 family protein n=1 Tax=Methylobacterium sp. WL64 TaxID=2603894 RepID=UPI0011C8AEF6|nr:hypothetical protein [Methylobacterium sp. WL64]TXM98244.1 hypothetical protein FV242_29365 [Methylobacterium sp. WL64]